MKNLYFLVGFFQVIFLSSINAQNLNIYFTTTLTPGNAEVKVFAQASPAENLTGGDFAFYYDNNYATFVSATQNPGLGWTGSPNFVGHTAHDGSMNGITITHTGYFSAGILDLSNVGTNITPSGVLLFTVNFTTSGPVPTFGQLANSAQYLGSQYFNSNGDSYDYGVSGITVQALPLELIGIKALTKGDAIAIDWSSAQEVDFSHFDLERSENGREFEAITKVQGKGGNSVNEYGYMDEQVKSGVTYYYRLKMNDNNGAFEYSQVVQAIIEGSGVIIDNVSPNPANRFANVNFSAPEATELYLQLFDTNGRLLWYSKVDAIKGANTAALDLSGFAEGVYWLNIRSADGANNTNHKIIKG